MKLDRGLCSPTVTSLAIDFSFLLLQVCIILVSQYSKALYASSASLTIADVVPDVSGLIGPPAVPRLRVLVNQVC